MKRVCIIGGGIVGSVAAFYLSKEGYAVDVYDDGIGQATKAAVGIICPWVSQRRNLEWYQLVEDGAKFYHQLLRDVEDGSFYNQSGSLHLHKNLDKLLKLAEQRQQSAAVMGEVKLLRGLELTPYLMEGVVVDEALYIEGAACVDGALMVSSLQKEAEALGACFYQEKVYLSKDQTQVINGIFYDQVIVSAGAWINEVFKDLPYDIDVYAQKGQLIEYPDFFDVNERHYPFLIPQGELDIMFDLNGSLIIGASHEKEMGFDLTPDDTVLKRLYHESLEYLPFLEGRTDYKVRVGTRAHSSDFNPFYGKLDDLDYLYVASALGSSGLTSGPIIGYRIAQSIIKDEAVLNQSHLNKYMKRK